MPWFRHLGNLGKVKMHLRAGPEGKISWFQVYIQMHRRYRCTTDWDKAWLGTMPPWAMYFQRGRTMVPSAAKRVTDNVGWNKEFASLLMVLRRMPQRSIWLMLTNEVPESKIAGVLQNFFLDFGFGQGKATRLTGAWDIHAELFWRLFFRFPNFHYDIVLSDWWKIPFWNPLTCSSNFGLRVPFTSSPGCSSRLAGQTPVPGQSSSRVHLVKKFTKNSFCIILPVALLLEWWIFTIRLETSRELIIW